MSTDSIKKHKIVSRSGKPVYLFQCCDMNWQAEKHIAVNHLILFRVSQKFITGNQMVAIFNFILIFFKHFLSNFIEE